MSDVRGLGAMMALELSESGDPDHPASELTAEVIRGCIDDGLLVIPAGAHANVLRVLCPLIIPDEDLQRGLDIIEANVLKR